MNYMFAFRRLVCLVLSPYGRKKVHTIIIKDHDIFRIHCMRSSTLLFSRHVLNSGKRRNSSHSCEIPMIFNISLISMYLFLCSFTPDVIFILFSVCILWKCRAHLKTHRHIWISPRLTVYMSNPYTCLKYVHGWFSNYIVLICQVFLVFIIYDTLLLFYTH